jgi:hypothetical protein
MSGSYGEIGEFEAAIAEHLRRHLPPEAADALAGGVRAGEQAYRDEPPLPGATALNLRLSRFVIRDQDLPFLETMGAIAAASVGLGAGGTAAWSAAIPALTSFASLLWNLRRKGAVLSADQQRLLALLRSAGPGTAETLASKAVEAGGPNLGEAAVEGVLKSLKGVETRDGTVIALVAQDVSGSWRALNV